MYDAEIPTFNPVSELRQLEDLIEQASASLAAQQEQLRRRRLAMPAKIISSMNAFKQDFKQLEKTILADQTELQQLRALADMSIRITNSLDIDTVLQETMELVIVLTQAERGYIILTNVDTGDLEFRISSESGVLGTSVTSSERPQISMSVVTEVMNTSQPLLADNAYQDERLASNQSIINFTLRSVLCVPLQYKDETIGVVYVDNRLFSGIFTEREEMLLMAFANTAAVAIANARMYTHAEKILV